MILSDLCSRFLNRKGFKLLRFEIEDIGEKMKAYNRIEGFLKAKEMPMEFYFKSGNTIAKAYDYYSPEKESSEQLATTSILISRNGKFEEISRLPNMNRLHAVAGQRDKEEFVFVPGELRDEIQEIVDET